MDTQTVIALFGLLGVIVTAVTGFLVARLTNRTEKHQAAQITAETILRERLGVAGDRLTLRDEQMEDLKEELENMTDQRNQALERNESCGEAVEARDMVIRELREELERMSEHDNR